MQERRNTFTNELRLSCTNPPKCWNVFFLHCNVWDPEAIQKKKTLKLHPIYKRRFTFAVSFPKPKKQSMYSCLPPRPLGKGWQFPGWIIGVTASIFMWTYGIAHSMIMLTGLFCFLLNIIAEYNSFSCSRSIYLPMLFRAAQWFCSCIAVDLSTKQ